MPRKASPLSSSSIGKFTWSYIFIRHMICVCLELLVWFDRYKITTLLLPLGHISFSNVPMTKGITYVVITVDKDLCRICGSQYEHPCSAIGYWLEICLGHVVLERVGSACLTFIADLYYEFHVLMNQSLFGIPDEIMDNKRSLEMVET